MSTTGHAAGETAPVLAVVIAEHHFLKLIDAFIPRAGGAAEHYLWQHDLITFFELNPPPDR